MTEPIIAGSRRPRALNGPALASASLIHQKMAFGSWPESQFLLEEQMFGKLRGAVV